jgi:putative ABC transport system permease protein
VIGVAAVISLVAVGEGTQQYIEKQYEAMGINQLMVMPGSPFQYSGPEMGGSSNPLTPADVDALRRQASSILYVAPEAGVQGIASFRGKGAEVELLGVTAVHSAVRNWQVARGRFITEADAQSESMVAVLSASAAQVLFGRRIDPVGETIRINRLNFKVTGVLKDKGEDVWADRGNLVLIPLRTAQARFRPLGGNAFTAIYLQAREPEQVRFAEAQVRTVLRARHRLQAAQEDDFWVYNQADEFNDWRDNQRRSTRVLGSIAAIALVVGGVGIMNIMLVSVTERTREVGLRKAVGARRRDILAQFLAEAVVLSLLGGVLGVGLGVALSDVAAEFIAPVTGGTGETLVTPDSVALALAVSLAIGIFFGMYPANRAARLNPIDALRYE